MADTAPSENSNRLTLYWQDCSVVYSFPGGKLQVEEVKAPWDLFLEGTFFSSPIPADEFHQILIKNGIERIFSIRETEKRIPLCTILTKPKDAPVLSFGWGARRVFRTSVPMTINKEKLIVLDVLEDKGRRASAQNLRFAEQFYLANGGKLKGEHPNCLVWKTHKEIETWRSIVELRTKLDIMASETILSEAKKEEKFSPDTVLTPNAQLTILMLSQRNWNKLHINGDEVWAPEVIDHMQRNPNDQPSKITVWGTTPRADEIFEQVTALFSKEPKK